MNKKQLKEKIDKLQKQLSEIEAKKKNKAKLIKIGNYLYETKEHDFNKLLSEIKFPKNAKLWLPSECIKFYEDKKLRNKLNLKDCWFFVKSSLDDMKAVARFGASSDRINLNCDGSPGCRGSSLGVRFKFKVKK